ncbi:hypothetical protein VW608_005855 [Pseudomonas aeruginosa]|nr:hypothetical protein [Pseudomonas aeruginosa]
MSMELNKALELLREIRPSIPKEVLELWCKDRDAFLASHPAVEQAGGDERAAFEQWLEQHMSHHLSPELDLAKYEDSGEYRYNPAADYWKAWQARAALAQPSPVRSSLLINGYQLRAALDFIAPDGTAEQLESETCIEWRQQDADFLEAGLYAFCAEYPEEGGVLLDEEPTNSQPSPAQELAERGTQHRFSTTEQTCRHDFAGVWWNDNGETKTGKECRECGFFIADIAEAPELERPEVVGYLATAEHPKHGQPHKAFNYFKDQHDAQVAHWRERGCTVTEDRLMTVAQHERIVGELRADRDSWAEQAEQRLADWDEMRKERDAALAEVERLRESKGDPVGSLEKCMKVMYERDEHAKRLEVALARVAELEGKLTDWVHEGFRLNEALAVAKAQHSVPDDDMILQIFADNAEHSEQGDEHGYCIVREQHAQAIARKLLAAAPGNSAQHSVPEGWKLVPLEAPVEMLRAGSIALGMEPLPDGSDGGYPITGQQSTIRQCYAAMLAAAPGKEVGHE